MREDIGKILEGKSTYAVVKYDNKTEYIYIHCFKEFKEDGSDWYLEYPCQLYYHGDYDEQEDKSFVEENCYNVLNGKIYEVVNWQCSPWLPEYFDMREVSELEMIKLLITNNE